MQSPMRRHGRKYLTFDTGERFYFPDRIPKTAKFDFNEKDPNDPYARLYSNEVVNAINGLTLPRYGLGNYIAPYATSAADRSRSEGISETLSRWEAVDGFLPNEPVQTAGKRRPCFHSIAGTPRAAKFRLSPCD